MKEKVDISYPLPMKIIGVGRYLPKRIIASSELEAKCDLPKGWCKRKQGINERRWIDDETVAFMASQAVYEAVMDAGISLKDIDLILNASNTYDRVIPDQSAQIQHELGLGNSGIPCISVNSGCLGSLVAMDMSASLLATGRYRNILIVSALVSSPGVSYDNPIVCTMLGDAAAAIIVTNTPDGESSGVHAVRMETYSKAADVSGFSGQTTHKSMFNKNIHSEDLVFEFNPQSMQSSGTKYNQNFISRLYPIDHNELTLVIPNQATRFAIDMMKLKFTPEKVKSVIDRFGNIGAVGYLMAIYEAIKDEQIERGDMILIHGMGAGFSILGMVLTY